MAEIAIMLLAFGEAPLFGRPAPSAAWRSRAIDQLSARASIVASRALAVRVMAIFTFIRERSNAAPAASWHHRRSSCASTRAF